MDEYMYSSIQLHLLTVIRFATLQRMGSNSHLRRCAQMSPSKQPTRSKVTGHPAALLHLFDVKVCNFLGVG